MPTKQVPIKAVLNLRKMSPEIVFSTFTAIYGKMNVLCFSGTCADENRLDGLG